MALKSSICHPTMDNTWIPLDTKPPAKRNLDIEKENTHAWTKWVALYKKLTKKFHI